MRNFKIGVIILIAIQLVGCAGYKGKRAKKKLKKHYRKIEQIVKDYPELSDTVFKVTHDTIRIVASSDSARYEIGLDSVYVDSTLAEYVRAYTQLKQLEKHQVDTVYIDRVKISDSRSKTYIRPPIDSRRKAVYSNRLTSERYIEEKRRLQKELDEAKSKILNNTCSDQTFIYTDSVLSAEIVIENGELTFKYNTKEKKVAYKKSQTIVNLDSTRKSDFYEDWKFWILLLIMLVIIIWLSLRKKN